MSRYLGNLTEDQTIDFDFHTTDSTGAPITLAGTPVISVYKGNATGTEKTSAEVYITLTVDFDSLTGTHHVEIDTGSDAFFAVGADYTVRITTGTVDGISVVGYVLANFSIENRFDEANVTQWAGTATTISSTTAKPEVDTYSVSDDATGADNLELQYDGTGLTGDEFPASQSQVGAIANVGSAVNVASESYVLTTGSLNTGLFSDTEALDAVYHTHNDAGGILELYYEFDVGVDGVPSSVTITGYLNSGNDDVPVFAYNWAGAAWTQIGTWEGNNSATNVVNSYGLFTSHVGTGAEDGLVRIRFFAASGLSTATLAIDQLYVSYAVVRQSVGYANGAIWIDTASGTAGTSAFVNGVADNPVDNLPDAITLSGILNIRRLQFVQGSSVQFVQTMDNYEMIGLDYTIDFNGQQVDNTTIMGAVIFGTCTGNGGSLLLETCKVGPVTLPDCALIGSAIVGPITLGDADFYFTDRCASAVAGANAPTIDFAVVGAVEYNMRHYSGGVEIQNMTSDDIMSLEGDGQLIINANCTGGNISVRGSFKITDNASGAVTLDQEANGSKTQIGHAVWDDVLADHTTVGTFGSKNQNLVPSETLNDYKADLSTLEGRLTAARAGYLDNLNIGSNVSSSTEVTSIQNNTRAVRSVPGVVGLPASGSKDLRVEFLFYDTVGNMEEPDSAPVISVANQDGTDRTANLDNATMALVNTGHYRAVYTLASTDPVEQINFTFAVNELGQTLTYVNNMIVVLDASLAFNTSDRAKLDELHDNRLTAARAGYLDKLNVTGTLPESIWGEVTSGNIDAGSFGEALDNAHNDSAAARVETDKLGTAMELDGSVYRFTTNALELAPVNTLTASEIADAVWDEATSGHVGAGSFGKDAQDHPTVSEIDTELTSTHGAGNWTGDTAATVADAVWDEAIAAHQSAGSTGETLFNAGGLSTSDIADAIWDEAASGHVGAGSTGAALNSLPTATEIDTELTSTHGGGSWQSSAVVGPGSTPHCFDFSDQDDNPLAGVRAWISMDEGGTNIVAGPVVSEDDGVATFLLDLGTQYYLWARLSGQVSIEGLLFTAEDHS